MHVASHTATQGYEQVENALTVPSSLRIVSVTSDYSVGGALSQMYGAACSWDASVDSPDYLSCTAKGGSTGG